MDSVLIDTHVFIWLAEADPNYLKRHYSTV